MVINPYDTVLGSTYNVGNLKKEMIQWLAKEPRGTMHNYEVYPGALNPIFIIGKDEAERNITPIAYPMIFEDHLGKHNIVTDVRKSMRIRNGEDVLNMYDIVTFSEALDFELIRTIYMMKMYTDSDALADVQKHVTGMFTKWVAGALVGNLNLTITDNAIIEVVLTHYMVSLFADDNDDAEVIFYRTESLLNTFGYTYSTAKLKEITSKLKQNPKTATDLAENIKVSSVNVILKEFNTNILYTLVGGTWYNNTNTTANTILAFEHMPTLITILYSAVTYRSYKRTKLTTIMTNGTTKRKLGLDEFQKNVRIAMSEKVDGWKY